MTSHNDSAGAVGPRYDTPDRAPETELVGHGVEAAARHAAALGWIVREAPQGGVVTADHNPGRITLVFDSDQVVVAVDYG